MSELTMQLMVNRLYGLHCESCEGSTRQGVQIWEFIIGEKTVHRVLCYRCAIQISVMLIEKGGILLMPNPELEAL